MPCGELAAAALDVARRAGASHADFRVQRLTTQSLNLRDGVVQSAVDGSEIGLAVRVVVDGTWGFASHSDLSVDAAAATARTAVDIAQALRSLNRERVELADEPVYANATWVSEYDVDPFHVPTRDKVELLTDYSARLRASDGVDHVTASVLQVKEQTYYADLAGSSITQQRVRLHPQLEATTVDTAAGAFETMRTLAPPVSRGWEYLGADSTWDWSDELTRIPGWLAEKVKSPSVVPGPTDLVIDPTNLWLTIHESIGHATEYDRAIGYEAAYAGTSFATPDQLGTLRYGSDIMHVTADRTEVGGLSTIGYDDDGVAAQQWDLIRDGVLVGYQLDRVFAPRLGLSRSNGCSYADSAQHVPIQRMANVSLQPGSTSSATRAGRSTCSATTSSSPDSGSSASGTACSTARCAMSPIKRRRPTSGDRWISSAACRRDASVARSTAERRSPVRSRPSVTDVPLPSSVE
ncbi:Metalloprotease TldD [Rhodococcus sp. B10]|nr:Metalloprotease TldD [Rhodococcus sp. B10]